MSNQPVGAQQAEGDRGKVPPAPPAFATDEATWAYYDQRAAEYDEWYAGEGQYARRARPGWAEDVEAVVGEVAALPGALTLDVACGTGFLGRHLAGQVVGVDRSVSMVGIARGRISGSRAVVGDALGLPFANRSFQRVVTGHFYGHLPPRERIAFLEEVRRVARELIVIDSAVRAGTPVQGWQDRVLNDGSRHRVYKRYFTGPALTAEIGGRCLHEGPYFVMAATRL